MGKKVFYDDDARKRLLAGAEILYNAVKTTMGPKGRNVIIAKNYGPGIVTHDGVTVARSIDLSEDEDRMGYKTGVDFVKSAAVKMNDLAGDGTTTVTVLTYHILNEANKLIAAGHNPMQLRKSLDDATDIVLENLKTLSEDISQNSKKIADVATISAGGDKEIGKLVADVIKQVGKDSVVTVEEGQGTELEKEIVKGYTFDKGYVSPYFVNDQVRMEAVLDNPAILITDQKIRSTQDFLPLVEKMANNQMKNLLVIAEDVEGEALQAFVLNTMKGTFNTVCVKAPSFGDGRKETLQDLAVLTGGTFVTEDQGLYVASASVNDLGHAKKVIVTKDETTIIEGAGVQEDIDTRVKQVEKQAETTNSEYSRDRYKQRAAALGGKVAIIRVGGVTETEIEEKKYRVDDAVHAAKAALAEGIVPGGGVTLLNLSLGVEDKLLRNALQMPFRILMENSGLNPDKWIDQIAEKQGWGVDVNNPDKLIDLKQNGVVDPTLVTKEAIQNAVSIAGTAMTMGALVVEEPVKEIPAPMPPMGGAM